MGETKWKRQVHEGTTRLGQAAAGDATKGLGEI